MTKRWVYPVPIPANAAQELDRFSPIERSILWRRGITTQRDAVAYFEGAPDLHDPSLMLGMRQAVGRIIASLEAHEPIAVYGDYDADGLTGTAILVSSLTSLGGRVTHFIPNRYREGYGLTVDALQTLAADGVRLVVTVDCGARSVAEAASARSAGLDMIITDHHAPGEVLPACVALINPRQPGDEYPFKDLSGAGLAFKLAQALTARLGAPGPEDLLDLVAIGTIADLVPLRGENRALTRAGLDRIRQAPRPGVRALMDVSGIQPGKLRAASVGFGLAPRLNAAGRLDSAEAAYHLLMADDGEEARRLAADLDRANRDRRQATSHLVDLARTLGKIEDEGVLIFAAHPDFREGLAGLVAARLAEEHSRPAVIAHLGETEVRASARSIPGFHITRALDECADLLIRYGGHAAAAGFTVARPRLGELADRLQSIAERELAQADLTPCIEIDARLTAGDISMRAVEFGESLEPCGQGNEAPLYSALGLRVRAVRTVGAEGKHLKLTLGTDRGPSAWDAIGFGMGSLAPGLPPYVDAAFRLERNSWGGYESLQLNLVDLRPAQSDAP